MRPEIRRIETISSRANDSAQMESTDRSAKVTPER